MTTHNLSAEETSGNLLSNHTFDDNTQGWTLSDSNVKRDANRYNDAGNSPTIRFKGQNSSVSQKVDVSSLESGKEITSLTIKYHGYGCGNDTNWCLDGLEDTIVTEVTLTSNGETETSTNTVTVPYEDGWTHHSFTKSINDTFITGDTDISFSLRGIDSGNSNSWLGPITDNYELLVTYQDYVVQQQVEQQIEQQIEEQITNTIVAGLDFETSVTNEIILERPMHTNDLVAVQVDIPTIEVDMTMDVEINMDMDIQIDAPENIEMPELIVVPMNINTEMDLPSELPQITEVAVIEEIPQISISEPVEKEMNNDQQKTETSEEGKPKAETESEVADGGDENSELSETPGEQKTEPSNENRIVKKSKSKDSKSSKKDGSKKTTKEDKKSKPASKTVAKNSEKKTETTMTTTTFLQEIVLPSAYLQVMTDSITIVETISLEQEMIYEQDLGSYASNDAWDSFNSATQSRWDSMVGVKSSHTFRSYGK